jgi:hypothetical protein
METDFIVCFLQINAGYWDAQGLWNTWEDQGYDNVEGKFGPTWEYVSGSKYQIDVWMRGNQHARFQNSAANFRSYTQENSAGSRWRVRKTSNPLAIESPRLQTSIADAIEYTATPSAGFGSCTNIKLRYYRFADRVKVKGTFTNGTGAGSAMYVPVPPGVVIDYSKEGNNTGVAVAVGVFYTIPSGGPTALNASPSWGVAFIDGSDTSNIYFGYRTSSSTFNSETFIGSLYDSFDQSPTNAGNELHFEKGNCVFTQ